MIKIGDSFDILRGTRPLQRLKHLNCRSAFIKERIREGELKCTFQKSQANRSNSLSKIAQGEEFRRGLIQLGIEDA